MPCATVHLLTAGRTLEGWRSEPAKAPFDPQDPSLRQDFLAGAMAPDVGFVPGVDRTVSELVHYVETGAVIRSLLAHAGPQGEIAFAWGWATHHLTDILIHPWVGKAVGEVLYGDRERRVNASENEEVHVSVEVGLDIVVQATTDRIPPPARTEELQAGSLDFVARALADTYRLHFDPDRLAGDFRTASRQIALWPSLIRNLGKAWRVNEPGRAPRSGAGLLSLLSRFTPPRSAVKGLCAPQRPPEWLPKRVVTFANDFPDRFQPFVEADGASLENRNLETGLLDGEGNEHPSAARRRAWWIERRAATSRRQTPETSNRS